jgi:hypothetical protein
MVTNAHPERCGQRDIAGLRRGFSIEPSDATSRLAAPLAHEEALI